MTDTVGNPAPTTDTVAYFTPATDTLDEPENQPVLLSFTPIFKKKRWKWKPLCSESEGTSSRRGKVEEAEEESYFEVGPSQE